MSEEDNEAYNTVMTFLFELFGEDAIPAFDSEELPALHKAVLASIAKEQIAQEQLSDNAVRAQEYGREAERMNAVLSAMGVGKQSLSVGGQNTLRQLSSLSLLLGADACLSSMLVALVDLQGLQDDPKLSQQGKLQASIEAVSGRLLLLREQVHKERDLQAVRDDEAKKQKGSLPYYQKKKGEYDAGQKNSQVALDAAGYSDAVSHSRLESQFKALENLRKENSQLSEELAKYADLDPHVAQAQAKLEASRAALAKLKVKYNEVLAAISLPEK